MRCRGVIVMMRKADGEQEGYRAGAQRCRHAALESSGASHEVDFPHILLIYTGAVARPCQTIGDG